MLRIISPCILRNIAETVSQKCQQNAYRLLITKSLYTITKATGKPFAKNAFYTNMQAFTVSKTWADFTPPICHIRKKYSKSRKGASSDEDEDELEDDFVEVESDKDVDKDGKVVMAHVDSLRSDQILKAGLRISRNKIEEYFYQSRIRLNGEKVLKKSLQVHLGDEIDIVKGHNKLSDRYLDVMRVSLIGIKIPKESEQSKLAVKLKQYKHLTVENYVNEWTGSYIE